jgi:hypothetical protein
MGLTKRFCYAIIIIEREREVETMAKKVYCPVNGWDCPYYEKGLCKIDNPIEECDDFATFWDEGEDYEAED